MKKFLKNILFAFILLPAIMFMAACTDGENPPPQYPEQPIAITSEMIALEYTSTVYNGSEKTPTVALTAEGYTVDSTYFNYSYTNNVDAGTATVTVTINQENPYAYGTASTTFEITPAPIYVSTLDEINAAINTTTKNHVIVLTSNITSSVADNGYIQPVMICPVEKDLDINIDLNGFDIATEIWITKEYYHTEGVVGGASSQTHVVAENKANVNITNSKSTGIIGIETSEYVGLDYPILMKITDNYNVNLTNVKTFGYSAGIYTNGSYAGNSNVTATNCTFVSAAENASAGAYFAGNVNYTFTNCTFTGFTGYYAKSGIHTLNNCTFNALAAAYVGPSEHHGNGFNPTGSAMCVDSSEGYQNTLVIKLYGGLFTTVSYEAVGIEEFVTYKTTPINSYSTVEIYMESFNGLPTVRFQNDSSLQWK